MRVLIRADASVEVGAGHVMRCLTLAEQLSDRGAEVAFVCRDLPGAMFEQLQERGFRSARLPPAVAARTPQAVDAKETIEAAASLFSGEVDWLVVDHYGLASPWEAMLRPRAGRIMVIDDLADREHDCDLLLDQNYYSGLERRYDGLVPKPCRMLLGPSYVLLRPEFAAARQKLRQRDGSVTSVLLFFGGSDPVNETQKAVEALKLLNLPHLAAQVVVGAGNENRARIEALCAGLPNATFHCQVSNMAEMILNADLGIGAGGSSMWERCCLGLPTITVVFAENQLRTTEDVAATGAIDYLGWSHRLGIEDYARAILRMMESPETVKKISAVALGVLGKPGPSVAELMLEMA